MVLNRQKSDSFQWGSWHNREAVELLRELRINRVEQDNPLQGVAPLPEALHGSLHITYTMETLSRNCPFHLERESGPCPVRCGDCFTLHSSENSVLLYLDGNTQFLHNGLLPETLSQLGIDRIVEHRLMGR
jgi:hypothetical protein